MIGVSNQVKTQYQQKATELFRQALQAEFFDADAHKIPKTGEATIKILAGTGTYSSDDWILDFTHVGAGSDTKNGQTIMAVCYKASDASDLDNVMTNRFYIYASSTTAAVGGVLEEMTKGL